MDFLKQELNLTSTEFGDDDTSVALSGLLVGAVRDENPRFTLDQLYRAILAAQLAGEIDPLTTVPLLLSFSQEAAQSLLDVVAEQTSAKELVIACEEATERLKGNLINASAEEDDDDDLDSVENHESVGKLSPAQQVARILRIYAKALPRLKLGKRSASTIIKPLLSDLELLIRFLGQNAEVEDGRDLVAAVAQLVLSLGPWIAIDEEDKSVASEVLYSLAISTLEVCAESISTGVAQRAFEQQFPRFRMPPKNTEKISSHEPPDIAGDILHALSQVGFTTRDFESRQSTGSLVLLSHIRPYSPSVPVIQSFLPVILTAVQTNTALEETLAFLLTAFGPLSSAQPRTELPPDLLVPLVLVLPPLAGAHPDAPIRHIMFRLLSLLLSLAPSLLRFQLLHDLLTDTQATSEQMRVAAVGLVKEAVLEGLATVPSSAEGQRNIFASPKFMQTFAPIIFRPQLPELSEDKFTLEEFLESPEPLRLVESLGLYYVVLQRDTANRTSIRDKDLMRSVEKEFLSVLQQRTSVWNKLLASNEPDDNSSDSEHATHDTLQLGILDMWLDRIQVAMTALQPVSAS